MVSIINVTSGLVILTERLRLIIIIIMITITIRRRRIMIRQIIIL